MCEEREFYHCFGISALTKEVYPGEAVGLRNLVHSTSFWEDLLKADLNSKGPVKKKKKKSPFS